MAAGTIRSDAPRLLIAGTGSGCGKTTTVCAILQAMKNRGMAPVSFKCGPDYIDPMFHTGVLGLESTNLDIYFSGEEGVRTSFLRHAGELNIIEGVMGYYDGLSMGSDESSSYHVARTLNAPVVLVVGVRGMALSAAAVVKGYMTLREPNPIRGVIFNQVSPMTYPLLKDVVESECGVPVLGYMPTVPEAALESRHLGLVTAQEVEALQEKMDLLAQAAERCLDLDGLAALANSAEPLEAPDWDVKPLGSVRVAVARDRAFCFYYRDNLELLEALGAKIILFSPLSDPVLPRCDGLYLGGGYPELYTRQLNENTAMRDSIRSAVEGGLPTIAECGGFMYLCGSIDGAEMAGVFPTGCANTGRLVRFGYCTLQGEKESLLLAPGDTIKAHEFHYWDAGDPGDGLLAVKTSGREHRCAYVSDTLYAGFPHLYFPSRPQAAARFIRKCLERKASQ